MQNSRFSGLTHYSILLKSAITRVQHTDTPQDRREVISRAAAAGVAAIVVTGCSVASSTAAAALCDAVQDYPLFFTAGVHPHNAKDAGPDTLDVLRTLAAHERCVAIGEESWRQERCHRKPGS